MADQAESLRRLVQARRDWEELKDGSSTPRRAAAAVADARKRARLAAERLGIGTRREPSGPRT